MIDKNRNQDSARRAHPLLNAARFAVAIFMLIFPCCENCGFAEDELPHDELEFLNQLEARRLFDLARIYCEQKQERAKDRDLQANWQLRLGELIQRQAWFVSTVNRNGLITDAIGDISGFIETNRPTTLREFELRIQQARLLICNARIQRLIKDGGTFSAGPSNG